MLLGDHLITMDLKEGYNVFCPHKNIRKHFHGEGNTRGRHRALLQYTTVPFGWTRDSFWVFRLGKRFWAKVMARYGYLFRSYMDEFAAALSLWRPAISDDCLRALKISINSSVDTAYPATRRRPLGRG